MEATKTIAFTLEVDAEKAKQINDSANFVIQKGCKLLVMMSPERIFTITFPKYGILTENEKLTICDAILHL
jgi:hypothetical protein